MDSRNLLVGFAVATMVAANTRPAATQAGSADVRRSDSWRVELAFATGPGTIPHPSFGTNSPPNRDPHLWLLAFRSLRRLGGVGPVELHYAPDLVQLILATGTPRYLGSWFRSADGLDSTYAVFPYGKQSVWGVGSAPLNLRVSGRITRAHAIYTEATGGVSWFSREIPDRGAGRVQFQLIVGAGVRLFGDKKYAVTIGYRHHHLSNGGLTQDNAALNTHLIQIATTLP